MAILTRDIILEKIKEGEIKIDPFLPENLGPGSLDLRLGNQFRIFKDLNKSFEINDNADYREVTDFVETDEIGILPQETILGITMEKISLPDNICGWLEGRSRFARLGLLVHISASFMQPGISNQQVLEISNMAHVPMRLHAGTRICQFIFEETVGRARYEGRFLGQDKP